MSKKKNKNIGKAKITEEEKIIGSQKCILKAIQLMATIDELEKRQIPMRGWVDSQLDEFIREREIDPFSQHQFSVETMLPPEFGFKSLVCETFFSQALAWWAKAQYTNQQKDKYLLKNMYASASWYNHFMERRNNLGSHSPNNERHKVPGDTWLIARGYYPFGDTVITAFKYVLSESMALFVPSQNKETTLHMCLGAFGINQIEISELQVPDPTGTNILALVVTEPTPLLYHIIPMPNGNWVCEAWDVDASNTIVEGGQYYSLPPEIVCNSPKEAFKALSAEVNVGAEDATPPFPPATC